MVRGTRGKNGIYEEAVSRGFETRTQELANYFGWSWLLLPAAAEGLVKLNE